MSVYSKLKKAQKREVFSGNPVPRDWMPSGSWDERADYVCFVRQNDVAPGAFKFVSAGKNLVKAIPVAQAGNKTTAAGSLNPETPPATPDDGGESESAAPGM